MTRKTLLQAGIAGLTLAACFAASPLLAETVTMKANLAASAEVPPNDSAATGSVTVTLDTASKKVTWQGTYSGLSGPATAGHFHGPAETGKNAGVAVPITPNTSPLQGSADLTDAQAADLLAGKWYVNIHTEAHKGGEIRGQVVK
jgi:CHRD domain-containing protein